MDDNAYHGLVGNVVRTISPHSEADPVAIMIQFLVAVGNLIGRAAWYRVERDRHHVNLFAALVGASAKGRKGTSWGWVKEIVNYGFADWSADRVKTGLSSGEGFINEVRDAIVKWDPDAKRWDETDPGIADKRLLVNEAEFAGALAVMARHGNTLSPLIRRAWDGEKLATLTKNSPLKATGAHISIIGHITEAELRARLTRTDAANGFANRFLFPLVKRSKLLPFGGDLSDEAVQKLGEKLAKQIAKIPAGGCQIFMTQAAKKSWQTIYAQLSGDKPGLLGAITARAEAQTIRLAVLYALLDEENKELKLDAPHLDAALAVWEYCEASAVHIFGGTLGDPMADEILRALKVAGTAGMTRTDIRDHFGHNQSGNRIGAALTLLANAGRASSEKSNSGMTGGHPKETWFAVEETE
jgi:hypothetical protein